MHRSTATSKDKHQQHHCLHHLSVVEGTWQSSLAENQGHTECAAHSKPQGALLSDCMLHTEGEALPSAVTLHARLLWQSFSLQQIRLVGPGADRDLRSQACLRTASCRVRSWSRSATCLPSTASAAAAAASLCPHQGFRAYAGLSSSTPQSCSTSYSTPPCSGIPIGEAFLLEASV